MVASWQQGVWQQLLKVHESGRLGHGLLLFGQGGWGKRFFARQFARYLLGRPLLTTSGHEHEGETREPDADLWVHPGLRIIRRTPSASGKSLRRQITVDQVRDLNDFLQHTASASTARRVVILELAEELNIAAANALLKSLEEPGADTHLLLISDQRAQVLPTVRSRCQHLLMPPGDEQAAQHWLRERLPDHCATELQSLLELSGGAPATAWKYAGLGALQLRDEVQALLDGKWVASLSGLTEGLSADAAQERAWLVLTIVYRLLARRIRQADSAAGTSRDQHLLLLIQRARQSLAESTSVNAALLLEDVLLQVQRSSAAPSAPSGR